VIKRAPSARVAIGLMMVLSLALANWTWIQGYYAVFTVACVSFGYFLAVLAFSIDSASLRRVE